MIAICTPFGFSEKEEWLTRYFESLLNLDYPKKSIALFFSYFKTANEKIEKALKQFESKYKTRYKRILVSEYRSKRETYKIPVHLDPLAVLRGIPDFYFRWWDIADNRNSLCRFSDPHDVIFADSDVSFPSDTIQRLEGVGSDISGGLTFYYFPDDPNPSRRVRASPLKFVTSIPQEKIDAIKRFESFADRFVAINKEPYRSFYCKEVPAFGNPETDKFEFEANLSIIDIDCPAPTLMFVKRRVLNDSDVKFYHNVGLPEGSTFCLSAKERGYSIRVDLSFWYSHKDFDVSMIKREDDRFVVRSEDFGVDRRFLQT